MEEAQQLGDVDVFVGDVVPFDEPRLIGADKILDEGLEAVHHGLGEAFDYASLQGDWAEHVCCVRPIFLGEEDKVRTIEAVQGQRARAEGSKQSLDVALEQGQNLR